MEFDFVLHTPYKTEMLANYARRFPEIRAQLKTAKELTDCDFFFHVFFSAIFPFIHYTFSCSIYDLSPPDSIQLINLLPLDLHLYVVSPTFSADFSHFFVSQFFAIFCRRTYVNWISTLPTWASCSRGCKFVWWIRKKSEIRWFCVFAELRLLIECEIIVMFEYQKFKTRCVARWAISFIEGVISAKHEDGDLRIYFMLINLNHAGGPEPKKSAAILNKVAVNINVLL